jgi:hypothetical protein
VVPVLWDKAAVGRDKGQRPQSSRSSLISSTDVVPGHACLPFTAAGILRQLLSAGGDVNAREQSGRTVAMALVMWGEGSMGACACRLRLLLDEPSLDLLALFEGATAEQWARVYVERWCRPCDWEAALLLRIAFLRLSPAWLRAGQPAVSAQAVSQCLLPPSESSQLPPRL